MDTSALNEIQERVNEICGQYGLRGEAAVAEDNKVWVFLEGEWQAKSEEERRKIVKHIEAIKGVDSVSITLAKR